MGCLQLQLDAHLQTHPRFYKDRAQWLSCRNFIERQLLDSIYHILLILLVFFRQFSFKVSRLWSLNLYTSSKKNILLVKRKKKKQMLRLLISRCRCRWIIWFRTWRRDSGVRPAAARGRRSPAPTAAPPCPRPRPRRRRRIWRRRRNDHHLGTLCCAVTLNRKKEKMNGESPDGSEQPLCHHRRRPRRREALGGCAMPQPENQMVSKRKQRRGRQSVSRSRYVRRTEGRETRAKVAMENWNWRFY